MSIPNLMSAITQGFNAKQIINWLVSNNKKLSKHIKSAKSQGYDDDQILTYLTKGKYASHGQRNQMLSGMTEQEKGTRILNQPTDLSTVKKGIGAASALAGGAYGIARGLPALARSTVGQNIMRRFGMQPPPAAPVNPSPLPNQPLGGVPTAQAVPQQAAQPVAPSPVQPQQAQATPQPSPITPESSINLVEQMGIGERIKTLKKAGNTPEAITTAISVSLKPHQKKFLEDQVKAGKAKNLPEIINDYLNKPETEVAGEKDIETQVPKVEPQKALKGDTVITSDGEIAELKSIRDKDALIDKNGKIEKVKASDLESLTQKYKDVSFDVSTVPESERSAPLYGISANRDNTSLTIEFFPKDSYDADIEYEYFRKDGKPFEEDLLKRLREGLDIPVTSGVEWAGFWNSEKADSRGSANHHEIKVKAQDIDKVQSGKEPNDPTKPLFFKKKEKLFTHGYHKLAKKEFGKKASEFKKEYKEISGEGKRKRKNP